MTARVQHFMTRNPLTIADDELLAVAHRIMREQRIRHLPVLRAGQLVGVISLRDLYFLETLRGVDPQNATVAEAMSTDIFAVPPATPLDEVIREMAENKYGSVVVVDAGRVVGVFTTIDALWAFLELTPPSHPRPRQPLREGLERR
jgi:acetoin utilization protein AcuB